MLVLASASPRRRELLAQAGFSFEVHPAHIPEEPCPNEDPIAFVIRLAREKAEAVFRQLTQAPESSGPGSALYQGTTSVVPQIRQIEGRALAPEGVLSESLTVLGADTAVTLDNHILGKPEDPRRRRPHVASSLRPHPSRHHRRRCCH